MGDSNGEASTLLDFKPSYVLIAIDTHESMFIKDENGDTPFSMALKACSSVADSLLLVQSKRNYCQFAIVFADEDSKASLLDFKASILDSIKTVKEKCKLSHAELKATYMRKGSFDLASFLLFCKKKFISISSAFYQRTIIYITNDPDPVCGDSQKRFTAINEAKNFKSNSITFQMVTMKHDFKYETFYNELFSVMNEELVEEIAEDEDGLFEKLSSIIVTRFSQRKLNFYPTRNDKTRYIPIVKKELIKSQKLLNNARVSRDGKLVKRCVKGGNNPSNKFSLKTHNDIVLTLEEKTEVSKSDLPVGLTLLYVSKRLVDIGIVISKPSLIEFNESSKENADVCRNYFSKFWEYCYEKDRVLICARKLIYNDHIRFVELIPKYAFNKKMFLMKTIPFQSEIKHLPPNQEAADTSNTSMLKSVTKDLVDKLTFDYDPRAFPDPCYAKKKAYVKSKLLNEPMEEVYDATLEMESLDERIQDVVGEFKKAFNLDTEASVKKRKMPAGGSRAKKAK